jgi:hypothetical protein
MEVSGRLHAWATVPPGKQPLDRRLSVPQHYSECCEKERDFLLATELHLSMLYGEGRNTAQIRVQWHAPVNMVMSDEVP